MKKILFILFLLSMLLSGCGNAAASKQSQSQLTPDESADRFMENLKCLNLDFINDHSDNFIRSEKNWLGVTTRKEYRIFNELLQPFHRSRKRYQANHRIAESLMQNLTWEITGVRVENASAEIDMQISNIDMAKATGYFEISLLEAMLEGEETGFFQFVKDMTGLIYSASDTNKLILAMESLGQDDISTQSVTLFAYQENGTWKFHLNDDFINASLGNINSADYPAEIKQQVETLTLQYEEKMNRMAEEFEQKVSGLSD